MKDLRTKDVEDEADEAVVSRQWQQNLVNENNVLEVVDDALAVEKVHGGAEPVPVKALGGAQVAGAAGDVGNSNDLLEGDDLDGGDNEDNVDVTHEKSGEEQGDHDEGPESTRVEVGLFLLVLGRLLLVGRRLLLPGQSDVEVLDQWETAAYLFNPRQLGLGLLVGQRRALLAHVAEAGSAAIGAVGVARPPLRLVPGHLAV